MWQTNREDLLLSSCFIDEEELHPVLDCGAVTARVVRGQDALQPRRGRAPVSDKCFLGSLHKYFLGSLHRETPVQFFRVNSKQQCDGSPVFEVITLSSYIPEMSVLLQITFFRPGLARLTLARFGDNCLVCQRNISLIIIIIIVIVFIIILNNWWCLSFSDSMLLFMFSFPAWHHIQSIFQCFMNRLRFFLMGELGEVFQNFTVSTGVQVKIIIACSSRTRIS